MLKELSNHLLPVKTVVIVMSDPRSDC